MKQVSFCIRKDELYALDQWHIDYKIVTPSIELDKDHVFVEIEPTTYNCACLIAAGETIGIDKLIAHRKQTAY